MAPPAQTSAPQPAALGKVRAPRWPQPVQAGLGFLLGILALLLLQYAWGRLSGGRPATAGPYRIDLNQASIDELRQLPGVGSELAEKIKAHRPYTNVEELTRVPGIGSALLERLRPHVYVTPTLNAASLRPQPPDKGTPPTTNKGMETTYAKKEPPKQPVNPNTASREELMQLPGIRDVLADRILADRAKNGPYRYPADLKRVKGIGQKTLDKMLPHLKFDEQPAPSTDKKAG